ncbi:MAG: RagB/SusD family nutrient uptake outer membrane protein, partial [Muribaculaceae bacterium]|nr:RagB/SusD family nutrient uptake outer membrane protein [Muribaculaceae bacterium]
MNKTILTASLAILLSLSACDSKLDIKPLGKTTLDKVEDLESLLNRLPQLSSGDDVFDLELICDNAYWKWQGVPEKLSNKHSIEYAYLTYDESIDRADLEDSNYRYNTLYSRINYMNVVISKIPIAKGDESRKAQLIAEARILRAWYHFLLVNIYAQQYDPKTAEKLGGIPYVDNTDVQEQKTKLSLSETYSRILEDCSDEVIADLHQGSVSDPCRFGSDFGYGVRARVLYQMKRYEDALDYASKALAVNSTVEDRSTIMSTFAWVLTEYSDNNYYLLYSDGSNLGDFYGYVVSPSVAELMSPMDYISAFHFADGFPAWADPYPTTPKGSQQCQISDIRWNVYGLRAESMYFIAAECLIRSNKIQAG